MTFPKKIFPRKTFPKKVPWYEPKARTTLSAFLMLAALLLALPACGKRAPSEPPGQPRIAVLSPALAVTLRDLGLESQIVARHGYDIVLPKSLPVVGDQAGIDYETLLRVDPSHILLEWGSRDLPPRLTQLAKERGWAVRNYPLLTLDDIRHAVRNLPRDLNTPLASARADELRARMDAAWKNRPGLRANAGRTLLLYSIAPPAAAGPGSFHAQLLEAIGGEPAITEGDPYITLDAEDVRRLNPDSIVLILPGAEPLTRKEQLGRLGTLDLRAVNDGRVLILSDTLGQTPSTAMIALADDLARGMLAWSTPAGAPMGPR